MKLIDYFPSNQKARKDPLMAKPRTKNSVISRKKALATFDTLCKLYPNPKTELTYEGPFQLLTAVILSAQCTDVRINQVTPHLFAAYPTPEALKKASQKEVEKIIHSCGFYRAKAKAIISSATDIVDKFDGLVPRTLEELITLSGVGRKTASVVLNQAFGIPAIAVDTHVLRVSQRLAWARTKTPEKIEQELKELLPSELWGAVNGTLILHGRKLCKARKPLCKECPIQSDCQFYAFTQC
ncbi:MAG: endonuclease III [Proteobacteria bacterium]|nr:endonuclease III [Pseudomonadota bacterium]